MSFSKNRASGFSLIELLVVIAVIGILGSFILPRLSAARLKARDAKRINDVKTFQTALELYWDDNGSYPLTSGWETALISAGVIGGAITDPLGVSYSYAQSLPSYCLGIDLEGVTGGDSPPNNHDATCATLLSVNYAITR